MTNKLKTNCNVKQSISPCAHENSVQSTLVHQARVNNHCDSPKEMSEYLN